MAILIVAGVTVPVLGPDGAKREVEEIGGDRIRMFDGGMRQTVRGRKSVWHFTTRLLTDTDRGSLETALTGTPPLICSGDTLGASTSCFAKLDGIDEQWTKGQIRYRVSFTLWQQ